MTTSIDNKQVAVLEKKIDPIIKQANAIVIKSDDDMKGAAELLSNLNKYNDNVVDEREKITKPLNEALKAARALFKPLETKLESGILAIRKAMTQYQTEKTRIADEEAKKIAARVGEGKGKLKIETAVSKMENIERPDQKVATDSGLVKFKAEKKFRVVDLVILAEKTGDKYILANETLIRAAMKAGTELPGVEYYTEQVPVNFR